MDEQKIDIPLSSAQSVLDPSVSGPGSEQPGQTDVSNPPTPKSNKKSLILVGVAVLLVAGVVGGGYFLWSRSQNQTIQSSPTPSAESTLDSTADWKTYTDDKRGFLLKYPTDFIISECKNGFHLFELSSKFKSSEFCETPPIGAISLDYSKSQLTTGFEKSEEYKVTETSITIDGIKAQKQVVEKLKDAPGPDYAVYVLFSNKDYFYNITLRDQYAEDIYNQILSTFKFVDESPSTTTQVKGASLNEIKYTLPETWTGKISKDTLLLSANGGGYLSITVHNYTYATSGRRDYYCKVREGVCLDSTKFTETKIGNIDGYLAEGVDNSGGGNEYFGAKGDKFYIIVSYNPPLPNEYYNNYQKVLDSLVF